MAKPRILGADAVLRGCSESAYGTAPPSDYKLLAFKAFSLDSERQLGYDPLLGFGRDGLDPYYEAINVTGDIDIPLDVQGTGWWLHGLMGAPTTTTVAATGELTFSQQPAANSTITLNGTVWTFVSSGATGPQTNIGVNLAATMTALASDLNASADTQVAKVTYTATATATTMVFDTAGTTGNSYTLAASATSNCTPSAATMLGGGYQHVFTAGGDTPSKTLEIGHPQITSPKFGRFLGCVLGGISFDMQRTGPANARINVIAQTRSPATATIDGAAAGYALSRFSAGKGTIKLGGTLIANVTGGRFAFTNNLSPVETIRDDGKIDGVDALEARTTGAVTVRASTDTTLSSAVDAETPVALTYAYSHPLRWSLTFAMPRVFLPKPKQSISGPAGVEESFDWQSARDSVAGYGLRVTLVNDVASYS